MHNLISLLNQYGYIVLFTSLALELIAFPTPGELLMTYCGYLVYNGSLNWIISILSAAAGAITGITIAYVLGIFLGKPFFTKYGKYIHLGPEKFERTSKWFNDYGNVLLFISYFIPGVRHVSGYMAGITGVQYKKFALHSYFGALFWAASFISLGKILGTKWRSLHTYASRYAVIIGIVIFILLLAIYILKWFKVQIREFIYQSISRYALLYKSMRRVKTFVIFIFGAFLMCFALLVKIINIQLRNDFYEYNKVVMYIIKSVFTDRWYILMKFFYMLTSLRYIAVFTLFICIWIKVKGTDNLLEYKSLISTILGGEILAKIVIIVFNIKIPSNYTFPSLHAMTSVIVFGYLAYIAIRHTNNFYRALVVTCTVIICLFVGLSSMYFNLEEPIGIIAGYTFGGAWLTSNIVLLEIFRIIPKIYET